MAQCVVQPSYISSVRAVKYNGSIGNQIEIHDVCYNKTRYYSSLSEAARYIGCTKSKLHRYSNKIMDDRYKITIVY
jgi:hypothetical protein